MLPKLMKKVEGEMRSFPSRETGEDWEKGDALRRTTWEEKIIKNKIEI